MNTGTAAGQSQRDEAYDLPEAGVFLEGIGVDQRRGVFYVSATNRDGTIYRGELGQQQLEVWVGPRAGDNGRGIDVDDAGRVYVAGGPSAEVRVFDAAGTLLAELPTGQAGSFLNDIWVGKDGAAYVTDSSLPLIWRVTQQGGESVIELWGDVSDTITYTPSLADFDLGGVVGTPDGPLSADDARHNRTALADRSCNKVDHPGGSESLAIGQRGRHRAAGPRSVRRTELQPSDHEIASVGRLERRRGSRRLADAGQPYLHHRQDRPRSTAGRRQQVRVPSCSSSCSRPGRTNRPFLDDLRILHAARRGALMGLQALSVGEYGGPGRIGADWSCDI
jgi:hypothetical protein